MAAPRLGESGVITDFCFARNPPVSGVPSFGVPQRRKRPLAQGEPTRRLELPTRSVPGRRGVRRALMSIALGARDKADRSARPNARGPGFPTGGRTAEVVRPCLRQECRAVPLGAAGPDSGVGHP